MFQSLQSHYRHKEMLNSLNFPIFFPLQGVHNAAPLLCAAHQPLGFTSATRLVRFIVLQAAADRYSVEVAASSLAVPSPL